MSKTRLLAVTFLSTLMLAVGLFAVVLPTAAHADTAPAAGTPATVTADVLPTVQINGVVWSTVTVGNVVYATGDFTSARPAGSAAGTNETPRGGILAFDITTGNLITSFNHSLNAAGRIIVASPDGSRIYVGGDFTTVDGQSRGHLVAFDTATGALSTTFAPSVDQTVLAVTATNSTVYAGGSFMTANGTARNRLAAFSAADGSLSTAWVPSADNGTVTAMVLAPGNARVVVAGRFTTLNGTSRYGIGAVDASSGALTAWNSSFPIRDAGVNSSITSLTADSSQIYATGYVFGGGGNFEGVAGFDATGTLNWLDSCHGDHYSAFATNGVVYSASHAHDCSDVGGWEDTTPRTWHRGMANTSTATAGCTEAHNNNSGYADFFGTPCAQLLDWYPDFAVGTYTGAAQGPWSVTGNTNYVVMGGEFPTVNKVAQYGLVRFAVKPIAPAKVAPIASTTLIPTVTSTQANSALSTWTATWDRDNQNLTYSLFRDGGTTPIYTTTQASTFWQLPTMSYLDTGVVGGTSHTYRLNVSDPDGNTITIAKSAAVTIMAGVNVAPVPLFSTTTNQRTVTVDASGSTDAGGSIASFSWNFGDGSTATGATASHTYTSDGTFTVTLTVTDNLGLSVALSKTVTVSAPVANQAPMAAFSVSTSQLLASFNGGGSKDADGSIAGYSWSFGDGSTGTGVTASHTYAGSGTYTVTLTVTDNQGATGSVSQSVSVTAPAANQAPTAAFSVSTSQLLASFNGGGSKDADGSIAGYSWNFGDGSTGTGVTASHTYAGSGTYTVTLTVTDNQGANGSVNQLVTVTAPVTPGVVTLASDDFGREVASGWGAAISGGSWVNTNSSASASVSGFQGTMTLKPSFFAAASASAYLNGVSSTDTDASVTFSVNRLSSTPIYVSLTGRRVAGAGEYRARVQLQSGGTVSITLVRTDSRGRETTGSTVRVDGLAAAANTVYKLRVQVTGTTTATIKGKVWKAGSTEPTAWQTSATSTTAALAVGGTVGIYTQTAGGFRSGATVISFDGLRVFKASTLG